MSAAASRVRALSALAFAMLLVVPIRTGAQPPPVAPNPQAPVLNMPTPAGMQRGLALEVTLTGANLAAPVTLWSNIPGAKLTVPTDNNNGKDAARLRVKFEIPADTPLGYYALRLATARGMSNLRLFCIDDLPQVVEAVTNRSKATPQPLTQPCVLVGRVNAESSAWFKITAKAGERISFDVIGHRLGSALDPQLKLFSAATGKELPGGFSNDAPGCQTDPRLTCTFKTAGDYLIELRDVAYRGGADYVYRLRIGDFPCATATMPMAIKRGSKATLNFAGPMVEGVPPVEVQAPTDPAQDILWVTPRSANGLSGWPVSVLLSDLDETLEQEPNNEPTKANRIPVPGAVSGRLLEKGDVDFFVFTAKKGQRLLVQAHTLELYSPTLLQMILRDAKGAEVGQTKPEAAPPLDQRIDFTPPADGDYTIEARHLNYFTGPNEAYRITVTPYRPGFTLSAALDRYDVPQTATVGVQLQLTRQDYPGPVEVSVVGDHPGITGQVVIAAGKPPAPNVYAGTLYISASQDVPVGAHMITLVAKATINQVPVVAHLNLRSVISQSLGGLIYPPRQLFPTLALAVTQKPPFHLTVKLERPEVLRGTADNVIITATKDPGFDEEIAVTLGGLPPTVPAVLKNIPKGKTEAKVQLTPAPNQPIGNLPFTVTGKAKFQNKDFAVNTPPSTLPVVLPFDLKVEPAAATLKPNEKVKVKVKATRKGGYQGPIALEVRNLPANVTAPKVNIDQGKIEVEIELAAAANAAPVNKADVNVLGTAPAAGNQQNASPNFAVKVVKP